MDTYDIVGGIVGTIIIVAFLIFMFVYVIPVKEEEDKKIDVMKYTQLIM